MSVSRKILLIALSFALPIAVLVHLAVTTMNANITFAQWELKGDEYQRPLEDLLSELQAEQIALHTDGEFAEIGWTEIRKENGKKIDEAFVHLEDVDRRLGLDLQFTDAGLAKRHRGHERAAVVGQEWAELASARDAASHEAIQGNTKAQLDGKFDHLVSDIRTMITHMGDTSNLILDPDLDSYYLMDVTLLALPQTQDRLTQATLYGYEALRREDRHKKNEFNSPCMRRCFRKQT